MTLYPKLKLLNLWELIRSVTKNYSQTPDSKLLCSYHESLWTEIPLPSYSILIYFHKLQWTNGGAVLGFACTVKHDTKNGMFLVLS